MNEDFLHFIWQHKLYKLNDQQTEDGQHLEIIHPGIRNVDSGPDFFNAKVKLDGTLWAGNIEIHINESDWNTHGHQNDHAYDNVILHIVANTELGTHTTTGRDVPVWKIEYSNTIAQQYQSLFFNDRWIPCEHDLQHIDQFYFTQWIDRMLIERLEEKSDLINQLLKTYSYDWDQVFFILLARSFGFGLNGLPFELMAKQTPFKILLKHSDNIQQLEALLFGQAGLLTNLKYTDDYTSALQKEYQFLSFKYQLKPIDAHLWKFLRLRPTNFPTIRIAQLACLLYTSKGVFGRIQHDWDSESFSSIRNIKASEYWDNHFVLGKASENNSIKKLGKTSQQIILYNTIYPYLFEYHNLHNNQYEKDKVIDMLHQKPAEKNAITSKWIELGIEISNEAQAQALIFLKKHYCNHKKCLNCHIGHKVLSKA